MVVILTAQTSTNGVGVKYTYLPPTASNTLVFVWVTATPDVEMSACKVYVAYQYVDVGGHTVTAYDFRLFEGGPGTGGVLLFLPVGAHVTTAVGVAYRLVGVATTP